MMQKTSSSAVLLAALLGLGCQSAAPRASLNDRIDSLAQEAGAESIAVAWENLDTGQRFFRNERETFHAASTMKVPVMLALFEAISRGELSLRQPVTVKNDFVSILDGSHYALEAREDSDGELYTFVGTSRPLEDLMRRMIVRSSNLATNILIEFVGAPNVMRLMKSIGANDIKVLRGVEDDRAYHAGMNNTTTANDLLLVLKTVAERRAISPEASDAMLDILKAQEHNDGIPAGLPKEIRVAHKTGSITKISHDAAVVYPDPHSRPYVLVILTRGISKGDDADRVIREISRLIWEARR